MEVRKVCVTGAGIMGPGSDQVMAEARLDVLIRDIEERFMAIDRNEGWIRRPAAGRTPDGGAGGNHAV